MEFVQRKLTIPAKDRGCYLITKQVCDEMTEIALFQSGFLHLFLQHTSAGISINENADATVRKDMETSLSRIVPESWSYLHDAEGPDDMPAHIKSALVGCELTIPVWRGKLQLGTWQGIYLHEFRNGASSRNVFMTLAGVKEHVPGN